MAPSSRVSFVALFWSLSRPSSQLSRPPRRPPRRRSAQARPAACSTSRWPASAWADCFSTCCADAAAPAEPGAAAGPGLPPAGTGAAGLAGAGQNDELINTPGIDVSATFGSHTQSQTSLARSATTGTLCAGYDDSYHLLTQAAGFSGFSRSGGGGAFSDGGALSDDAGGEASVAWRRSDGAFSTRPCTSAVSACGSRPTTA